MTYPGGKAQSGVYQAIINQMPPHFTYIEPFLGGGAIMLHKRPAARSWGVEIDPAVLMMWRGTEDGDGLARRVPGLTVRLGDGVDFLREWPFEPGTLVYCDPPYLKSTRSCAGDIYDFEFGDEQDHRRLLAVLASLPCMVAVSSYPNILYQDMLADWRVVPYSAVVRSGRQVTEWLWCNYPEPQALHDYRYLGVDHQRRQDFKRMCARWRGRLAGMNRLKRMALLAALDGVVDFAGGDACVDRGGAVNMPAPAGGGWRPARSDGGDGEASDADSMTGGTEPNGG